MKANGFILAIIAAIAVAYFFPQGIELLPFQTITDIGIGLIFFFYGLKLSAAEFKTGLKSYKVHVLVQLTTFVIFPLLCLAAAPLFKNSFESELWLAIFFLAALPSTVSSSVVMVALAKGNLPAAIFNASLSGLLGIIITPLWLSFFLKSSGNFEFTSIITKLFFQIILPLIIGLILQPYFGKYARKYGKQLSLFDKTTIILIVYSSFSASFQSNLFASMHLQQFIKMGFLVLVLFFIVYFGLAKLSDWLKFNTKDKITTQFCGTKKSLVHGSVMVKVIFGQAASTGIILLPIMIYHSMQLLIIANFAECYRKRKIS